MRTPLNTAAVGVMILEEEIATLTASGVAVPARIIEVLTAIRDACGNALEVCARCFNTWHFHIKEVTTIRYYVYHHIY